MKKPFSFSAFLILCALLFTACGVQGDPQPPPVPGDPPYQIIFFGPSDLTEFFDAQNLSDEDLETFLKEKNYSMNGVRSREELEALCQQFAAKPLPTVKDAVWTDITIYVETATVYIRYERQTGEVYSFTYSLLDTLEEQDVALGVSEALPKASLLPSASSLFQVYQFPAEEDDVAVYVLSSPELWLSLRLFHADPDDITTLLDITLEPVQQ